MCSSVHRNRFCVCAVRLLLPTASSRHVCAQIDLNCHRTLAREHTLCRQTGRQNIERHLLCPLISLFDLLNTLAIASVANAQMITQVYEQRQIRQQCCSIALPYYLALRQHSMHRLIAFCRLQQNSYLGAMCTQQ